MATMNDGRRRMANGELEFMENLLATLAQANALVRVAVVQCNDEEVLDTLGGAIKELSRFKKLLMAWLSETYEAGAIADVDYDEWQERRGNSRDELVIALANALERALEIADQIPRQDDDENGVQLRMIK